MATTLDDVRETFEMLDDWTDRYGFLIELGRELPPYPEELRDKAHKVKGCLSQVWIAGEVRDGAMHFKADSDAHIVKGLVALVCLLFEGKSPVEIATIEHAPLLRELGLDKHLSPGRSNGLHSMLKRIQAMAAAA